MEAVSYWVARIEANETRLLTSVITTVEILEGHMTPAVKEQFNRLFDRSNILAADVTDRIADKAHELRDHFAKRGLKSPDGKTDMHLCTPDAIHLATAIVHKVDEFHTFDLKDKRGCLGLLPLSGHIAGNYLNICEPSAPPPPAPPESPTQRRLWDEDDEQQEAGE